MTNALIFIAVGLLAGILSGFFGIGGGIIIVPALIYICGFSQLKAQGTSLAVLLPPVGILAFLEYYKKGNVDLKAAILICITVLIGAMLGGKIVQHIPDEILKKGFAVFMLLMSVKMLFGK
ncbi:MAG: sulfite exporter TauE/SafE family protein [Bacillota bacterium]|nr:sulfite exporter TauE/SafE family protein [Bacillota bacterium]